MPEAVPPKYGSIRPGGKETSAPVGVLPWPGAGAAQNRSGGHHKHFRAALLGLLHNTDTGEPQPRGPKQRSSGNSSSGHPPAVGRVPQQSQLGRELMELEEETPAAIPQPALTLVAPQACAARTNPPSGLWLTLGRTVSAGASQPAPGQKAHTGGSQARGKAAQGGLLVHSCWTGCRRTFSQPAV